MTRDEWLNIATYAAFFFMLVIILSVLGSEAPL